MRVAQILGVPGCGMFDAWGNGGGAPTAVPTAMPTTVPVAAGGLMAGGVPLAGGSFGAPVAVAANGQMLTSPGGSMRVPVGCGGSMRAPVAVPAGGLIPQAGSSLGVPVGSPVGSVGIEPIVRLASGPGAAVTPVAYGQQRVTASPPGTSVIRPQIQPGQFYA